MTEQAIEAQVATQLLAIKAVKLQPNEPFTWASGIKSPIYTDNRETIGYPSVRKLIAQGLADLIKREYPTVEIIGGVATAGIPHAAWVADLLDLPMVYVRSKPKDHGVGRQIEGRLVDGKKLVLIDDLISTGGSVLGGVEAARKEGADVLGVVSIFTYELPAGDANFAAAGLPYKALTNYSTLIDVASQEGYIKEDEMATLHAWKQDPATWGK